jgi:hypothetical protein
LLPAAAAVLVCMAEAGQVVTAVPVVDLQGQSAELLVAVAAAEAAAAAAELLQLVEQVVMVVDVLVQPVV